MFEKKLREDILEEIEKVIHSRKQEMPDHSYVSALLHEGEDQILKKISEEACELILASKNKDDKNIIEESSDLIFHVLILLGVHDIPIAEIYNELKHRYKSPTENVATEDDDAAE